MEDADAAAMAEAMGFSSFGSQAPNKRRRFNPATDAVVANASTATSASQVSSKAGGGPMSSGSNSTPLGTRTQNKDEIALDLDEDDDAAGGGASLGAAVRQDTADGDDPEPQYLDTSRPSDAPHQPNDDLQAKIDSIVGPPGGNGAQLPPRPTFIQSFDQPARGGHGSRGGYQSGRGRGREPGKMWYEDYYDPSFNTNPWERLEQSLGIEPRDHFMSWEEAKRR